MQAYACMFVPNVCTYVYECMYIMLNRQPNLNWKTLLVFLNGAKLQYVDSYKYLGRPMFIHVRNDDLDIVRQFKSVILWTNIILMRTCSSCSVAVKLFVFKSYCSNFYCSHLWYKFTTV